MMSEGKEELKSEDRGQRGKEQGDDTAEKKGGRKRRKREKGEYIEYKR